MNKQKFSDNTGKATKSTFVPMIYLCKQPEERALERELAIQLTCRRASERSCPTLSYELAK